MATESIIIKMIINGFFLPLLLPMVSFSMGAPVDLQLVDMTHVFDNTTLNYPTVSKFRTIPDKEGISADGYWMQLEDYFSSTHAGTHMDAPCHYAKDRWCIDDIPLNRFIAPAAVVDIRKKSFLDQDAYVEVGDLKHWEKISGRSLDGTIVLILTGWGSKWPDEEAYIGTSTNDTSEMHFPGLADEATQWLVQNRFIYGLGVDTLSLDNAQSNTRLAHRLLLGNNIYGLENVANVDQIPIYGATLYVMPMKIGDASGAPVRIVATFDRSIHMPESTLL